MNQHDIDDHTLALLQRSDPAHRWTDADSRALLSSDETLRFLQSQIDASRRSPSQRRRVVKFGALSFAAAAAGVLAVNLAASGHGTVAHALHDAGVTPGSAQASTVQARALKALAPGSGQILDVDAISTQKNTDGSTQTWEYRYWSSTTYPYPNRVLQSQDGQSQETALAADGYQELYDPSTNTIYKYEPRFDLKPGTTPGTETLTVPSYELIKGSDSPASSRLPAADTGTTKLTVTDAQVRALKTGADEVGYLKMPLVKSPDREVGNDPFVAVNHGYAIDPVSQWSGPVKKLLNDPSSTVDKSASYDGQPAIKITGHSDGTTVAYWVAPRTYAPLQELRTNPDSSTVTTTFPTYTTLRGAAASPNLLSLAAQHPTAKLDTNASDYEAAESRIFQNG